ncbi:hypothetical protein [Flavivirga jejuensis]|uniref:Uncharacterized protein n=1 Tax=Flavivirga jejuensis TaxID=870487 RepID=A0ABT8WPU1_9FLAO|nr:hypothetical protein [Flavivirga jejuensis]MDO5975197.1 hypothetical protein [Flavivirga jejuensis]
MEATSCILNTKRSIDDTWVNDNEDTKSTTKIIISNNGKHVQIFEKANSKDCDWGTEDLIPESNSTNMYWTIFDTSTSKSTFIFTINKNKMEVRYERAYKSSTKESEIFVENFTRLNLYKQEPIKEEYTIKRETPGFFYFLPSTYHLQYNEDKSYKRMSKSVFSRSILTKVRYAISSS